MKFKVSILLFTFILGLSTANAQNYNKVKLADKKVENLMFVDAIELYKKSITKSESDQIYVKIAHCYMKLNDPKEVAVWYNKVSDKNAMEPIHYYNYAQALSSLGRFEEAKTWYTLYEEKASDDLRAQNKVYGMERIEEYYRDSAKYEINSLDAVNGEFSEFAPAFYKEGIVFPSSRVTRHATSRTFKWDNSSFLDLYYSKKEGSSLSDYSEPVLFSKALNTKYHEGALTFSEDGQKVIFTRNNYYKGSKTKSDEGTVLLKLYYAEHKESKDEIAGWGNVTPLPFNSDEYYTRDPSCNSDMTVLYFVSNMPGGFGGADIYRTTFENDEWTKPVNLGADINTEGNEGFPFLTKDDRLLFTSDGRDGLGGLDIYEAKQESGKWIVQNMGYPINTSLDDFGLIMDETNRYGYFSSNRPGGQGSDDIYSFRLKNISINVQGYTSVKTIGTDDNTKVPLEKTDVYVYNKTHDKYLDTLVSGADGGFNLDLEKGFVYEFRGSKGELIPAIDSLDLQDYSIQVADTVQLLLIKPLVKMEVVVKDKDTDEVVKNATVYLMNQETKEVTAYSTDEDGVAILTLNPETEYVMKGTKVKYLSDCVTFNSGEATGRSKTPERPLYLELFKVSQKFKIENVFFDVNKDDIRPDAAIELDKVVTFIKSNPGIMVELGSHTDSRGSDEYNEALSERRAKSSRDYIVSKGVAEDAITSKGYGENELTNDCKNGVKCSDELHQENRRTEIKITGIKTLSPEEEAKLETNKKGLTVDDNLSDCNRVELLEVKK